jgi:hypothetical protein
MRKLRLTTQTSVRPHQSGHSQKTARASAITRFEIKQEKKGKQSFLV